MLWIPSLGVSTFSELFLLFFIAVVGFASLMSVFRALIVIEFLADGRQEGQ